MQKRSTGWGIYDTETDSWTVYDFPSITPFQQSPVLWGDKIYMAGGYDINTYDGSSRFLIYDIPTNTWTEDTLLVARACGMAGAVNGKVIIAGGAATYLLEPGTVTNGLVEIYDTQTDTWNYEFTLSQPRSFMDYQRTAPVVGNQIFFPGGDASGDGQQSSRVDIYSDSLSVSGSHFVPKLPETAFQLSPVPCRDFVNIHFDLSINEAAWLTIFDINGRQVVTQQILPENTNDGLTFNTSEWPQGNYLVALSCTQGVLAKRLVKVE